MDTPNPQSQEPVVEQVAGVIPATPQTPVQTPAVPAPTPEVTKETKEVSHSTVLTEEETQRYTGELEKDGKLSDASYSELEKRGFPRKMVDAYVKGIQAEHSESLSKAYEVVGGKQQYDNMVAWASKSLSQEQKSAFNSIFATGDPVAINMGLKNLEQMFKEAVPQAPQTQLTGNGGNNPVAGDVFKSRAEMSEAMKDPEYWKNPAKQREISEKIQRSLAAGFKLS